MEHFIAVVMPEVNEGKEGNIVCLVKGANLEDVKDCIFGKDYGIQGSDWWGIDAYEFDSSLEDLRKKLAYHVPILNFRDFKVSLIEDQLTWYKVIEWQRWGLGFFNEEEKLITLKSQNLQVSNCFVKYCGYGVVVSEDRDEEEMVIETKRKRREKRKKLSEIRNLLKEALGICKTILRNPSKARKEARKYLRCIFRKAQEDD